MVALATLDESKRRLNIDTSDFDQTIEGYIEAASASVVNYLKGQAKQLLQLDGNGEMPPDFVVPPAIVTATIMLVGYWFRNPDADPDGDFEQGYLPKPVTAILYPLRDPALA
ncbi:head-tail connector protein [Rhodoligotrophos ferricapiens]|uniref:head-tail connector protein n=1 Tax=Rhodoligotrophos ferricapiens TaxID=3069264 RepID=UPI00315D62C1